MTKENIEECNDMSKVSSVAQLKFDEIMTVDSSSSVKKVL